MLLITVSWTLHLCGPSGSLSPQGGTIFLEHPLKPLATGSFFTSYANAPANLCYFKQCWGVGKEESACFSKVSACFLTSYSHCSINSKLVAGQNFLHVYSFTLWFSYHLGFDQRSKTAIGDTK